MLTLRPPPRSALFPYTTLFRSPSEAAPVLAAVRQHGVELAAIWNTHHHWDHTGGNQELVAAVRGLEVVGHESDRGRRSEEHTSELQSRLQLVCRLLLEKKKEKR